MGQMVKASDEPCCVQSEDHLVLRDTQTVARVISASGLSLLH